MSERQQSQPFPFSSSPSGGSPSGGTQSTSVASATKSSGLPAFAYPIPIALALMVLWGTLATMFTAPNGATLLDEVTQHGTARVSGCHRAWQSLGRTTKCQADIDWLNGDQEQHVVTSVNPIADGDEVVVVERWTYGALNTNTGEYQRNARQVVTADHPHRHGLTDGSTFWATLGAVVILVLMIIVCAVIGRVGARREHQRRLHQIMNRDRTEPSATTQSPRTNQPSGRRRGHDERI